MKESGIEFGSGQYEQAVDKLKTRSMVPEVMQGMDRDDPDWAKVAWIFERPPFETQGPAFLDKVPDSSAADVADLIFQHLDGDMDAFTLKDRIEEYTEKGAPERN